MGDYPQANDPLPSGSGLQSPVRLRPRNPLFSVGSSSEDSSSENEISVEYEAIGKGRFSKRETRLALKESKGNRGRGPPIRASGTSAPQSVAVDV